MHYIECAPSKISPQKKYRISDIIDQYFPAYVKSKERKLYLKDHHWKAINKIRVCHTAHLGIAHFECPTCKKKHYLYRSCKHRFCPTCGVSETNKWAEHTLAKLLDIKHHHIVMTLPKPFRNLAKINDNLLFNILFKASNQVLKEWFEQTHQILPGIISVLHTAGSDLKFHPHVHMIVTAGGKKIGTNQYTELKGNYLCPQRLLGKRLKVKFQQLIIEAYQKGKLNVFKSINSTADLKNWIYNINQKHWIVSIQKPLNDLEQIVGYVGRYTKRCCLSEYKIKSVKDGKIAFTFNDYKNTPRGQKPVIAVRELKINEFFDRLLQHVPLPRFRMVRYGGLYNVHHLKKIPLYLRGKVKEPFSKLIVDLMDREWGEYEDFRKKSIRIGRPDPLFCTDCNKDMILIRLEFKQKKKFNFFDDS